MQIGRHATAAASGWQSTGLKSSKVQETRQEKDKERKGKGKVCEFAAEAPAAPGSERMRFSDVLPA